MRDSAPSKHRSLGKPVDGRSDFDLSWIGRSTGRSERRQVVVLAIGFSSMAGDPEEIAEGLERRRKLVARLVERFGGSVTRVDPDMQVASWGWPIACEADPRMAVAAALEIAAAQVDGASCGVDAGIAITPDSEDPSSGVGFVGDMVGMAVSLQRAADAGRVVISGTLQRLIGGAFETAQFDHPAAPVGAWRALRRTALPRGARTGEQVEIIGRSRELSTLLAGWRDAVGGAARALCLVGEPGVGKSVLLERLERTAREEGAAAIVVHCRPETQHLALEPVRLIWEQLAQPGLAALGSLVEAPKHAAGLLEQAQSIAARTPLLLVVEDLQWCDEASVAFLRETVGQFVPGLRLLLVSTCRPMVQKSVNPVNPALGEVVPVRRLSALEIERMLAHEVTAIGLGLDVRRRIAEHADGVPLYAIELAHLCAEAPGSDAHHRLLSRPNRLNATLTSRLDALATLKPLAQAAAVLGRRFDVRVLAVMLQMDVRALGERLQALAEIGILDREPNGVADVYRFRQALLWSQAYGSVLKARRRQLHARAARVLAHDFPALGEAAPETVAHHFRKAGDHANAFGWWRTAAHACAAQGASATAVAHITQALAAKEEAPEACDALGEAELLSLLGAQLGTLRGNASRETVAAYERALQLIGELPARPADLGFDIGWGLVAIHLVRGNVREALTMSGRLLEDARECQREDVLLLALRMHGTARMLSGHVAEAVELLGHAAELYDPALHGGLKVRYVSDPGAVALAHLASAQALAGQADASRQTRDRALKLAGDIGHSHTSANVLGVLSLAAVHLDDPGMAAALARASRLVAEANDHTYWTTRAGLILAWENGRRHPANGLAPMLAAVEQYHKTGAGRVSVLAHCLAADIAIRAGHPQEALDLLGTVADAGEVHGEWIYAPETIRLSALAIFQLDRARREEALVLLDKAASIARAQGTPLLEARAGADRRVIVRPPSRGAGGRARRRIVQGEEATLSDAAGLSPMALDAGRC